MRFVDKVNLKAGEVVLLCMDADKALDRNSTHDQFWLVEVGTEDESFPDDGGERLDVRALLVCRDCASKISRSAASPDGEYVDFESGGHIIATEDRTFP